MPNQKVVHQTKQKMCFYINSWNATKWNTFPPNSSNPALFTLCLQHKVFFCGIPLRGLSVLFFCALYKVFGFIHIFSRICWLLVPGHFTKRKFFKKYLFNLLPVVFISCFVTIFDRIPNWLRNTAGTGTYLRRSLFLLLKIALNLGTKWYNHFCHRKNWFDK